MHFRVRKEIAASLELLLREDFSTPYPSAAVELLGRAFPLWQAHLNGAAIIRHLVSLTGLIVNNAPQTPTSPFASVQKSLTPAIMIGARQAITCIASSNSGLVISTLSFDLLHAKTDGERSGCLKLIGMFFGKVRHNHWTYSTA